MMLKDRFGKTFMLTRERQLHIIVRHPEMKHKMHDIKETLEDPDIVIRNLLDENIQLYHKFYKDSNSYVVVVVNVTKAFILTAYESFDMKKGELVWEKS